MRIVVVDAVGFTGKPGILSKGKSAEIEVPEGSSIKEIWQEATKSIDKEPFMPPITNRYEVPDRKGGTKVVPSSYILSPGEILYLTVC